MTLQATAAQADSPAVEETALAATDVNGHAGQHRGGLAIYDKIGNLNAFIDKFGADITRSRLLGCETIEQGRVMAMECLARRCTALTLARQNHIIQGKASPTTEYLLGAFRAKLGGSHVPITVTPDKAEVELTLKRTKLRFALTWEEVQQESYVWQRNKDGTIKTTKDGQAIPKDNWATPRGRMAMLWWRVVSFGVGVMAPEIGAGLLDSDELATGYEPGEFIDAEFEVVAAAEAASPTPAVDPVTLAKRPAAEKKPAAQQPVQQPAAAPSAPSQDHRFAAIATQFQSLGFTREQSMAMIDDVAQRVGTKLADLTAEQIETLCLRLKSLANQRAAAVAPAPPAPVAPPPPSAFSEPARGQQCSEVQIGQIRVMIEEIEKHEPNFREKIKQQLQARGKTSFMDVTREEADELLSALYAKAGKLKFGDDPPAGEAEAKPEQAPFA